MASSSVSCAPPSKSKLGSKGWWSPNLQLERSQPCNNWAGNFRWALIFAISMTVYGVAKIKTAIIYSNRNLFCPIWYRFSGYYNVSSSSANYVWYHIRCLPFIYSFQVDYVQESPSSVIIIVLSQHLCWLHTGITVVWHNHSFIRSPNSMVGSFEIAKIKIAQIIPHTFTFKSRKISSAKIFRYTVVSTNLISISLKKKEKSVQGHRRVKHNYKKHGLPDDHWVKLSTL